MSSTTGEISEGGVCSDEAIRVGPFIFSLALQPSWQDRDNIHILDQGVDRAVSPFRFAND